MEGLLHVLERDPVLRSLGTGETRYDAAQVKRERFCIVQCRTIVGSKETLLFGVTFDQRDLLGGSTGLTQVLQRDIVDRKETHRCTILGGHVGDRRSIGDAHRIHPHAEELDKLSDDTLGPQQFDHGQDHVSCRSRQPELRRSTQSR